MQSKLSLLSKLPQSCSHRQHPGNYLATKILSIPGDAVMVKIKRFRSPKWLQWAVGPETTAGRKGSQSQAESL